MKYIIDLGGSVISPAGGPDPEYLKKISQLIKKEYRDGSRFVIIVGGGNVARQYLKNAGRASSDCRDKMGICATQLNARLLQTYLEDIAEKDLFDKRYRFKKINKVIIGCGWEPGNSTDYVSFQTATDLGIKKVIILSNIPCVFDSDPKNNKKAQPLEKITWKDYIKNMPKKWQPGLSVPLDQKAALLGKKEKMECYLAQGRDLKNFQNILRGNKFRGTTFYDG
jgi:uridylate kinase